MISQTQQNGDEFATEIDLLAPILHEIGRYFYFFQSVEITPKQIKISGYLSYSNGQKVEVKNVTTHLFDQVIKRRCLLLQLDILDNSLKYFWKVQISNQLHVLEQIKIVLAAVKEMIQPIIPALNTFLEICGVIGVQIGQKSAFQIQSEIKLENLKRGINQVLAASKMKIEVQSKGQGQGQTQDQVQRNNANENVIYDKKLKLKKNTKQKIGEGGYFSIWFGQFQQIQRRLAIKTLKQGYQLKQQYQNKFKRELKIIQAINDPTYLIKYYVQTPKNSKQSISIVYMDYHYYTLEEYLRYSRNDLKYVELIDICLQIIQSVINLHESNVVHRDIKPSNFLIDDESINNQRRILVKIIDFADSYLRGEEINLAVCDFGCSHPYSPNQCSQKKSPADATGITEFQIDYWSVGVVIYETFFQKLPINFSRPFIADIVQCWETELLLTVNQRKKYGLKAFVEDTVILLCWKMVKVKQSERKLNLYQAKQIMTHLKESVIDLEKTAYAFHSKVN